MTPEQFPKTPMRMRHKLVLRVVSKILIPFILLFALYVQFHGDFGPGGGFQAGVIFAAGLVIYGLIFGLADLKRVIPVRSVEVLVALGVLIYGGVGIASILMGDGSPGVGNFLDYNVFGHHPNERGVDAHGQHIGILLVEAGVGITVTAAMLGMYYMFAGRGEGQES